MNNELKEVIISELQKLAAETLNAHTYGDMGVKRKIQGYFINRKHDNKAKDMNLKHFETAKQNGYAKNFDDFMSETQDVRDKHLNTKHVEGLEAGAKKYQTGGFLKKNWKGLALGALAVGGAAYLAKSTPNQIEDNSPQVIY